MPDEDYADDDPEYEADQDDDDVLVGLSPADPQSIPPDEGDAGRAGD